MTEEFAESEQVKILRALVRLKHSIQADREIKVMLDERVRIGTEGAEPRLQILLSELTGGEE